jgi:hypothetical protein
MARALVQPLLNLCDCEKYARDRHTFLEVTKDIDPAMSH